MNSTCYKTLHRTALNYAIAALLCISAVFCTLNIYKTFASFTARPALSAAPVNNPVSDTQTAAKHREPMPFIPFISGNSAGTSPDKEVRDNYPRIKGIMYLERAPMAVLEYPDSRQVLVKQGDTHNDLKIIEISHNSVTICNAKDLSAQKKLTYSPSTPNSLNPDQKTTKPPIFVINKKDISQTIRGFLSDTPPARYLPFYKDGKPLGFFIYSLNKESIFTKAGIVNGDIIQNINGEALTPKLMNRFFSGDFPSNISLQILRGHKPYTMSVILT